MGRGKRAGCKQAFFCSSLALKEKRKSAREQHINFTYSAESARKAVIFRPQYYTRYEEDCRLKSGYLVYQPSLAVMSPSL